MSEDFWETDEGWEIVIKMVVIDAHVCINFGAEGNC